MENNIDTFYLNKLYDDLTTERNSIQLEFKNDKELVHSKTLTTKMNILNSMIAFTIKYRNIKNLQKLKDLKF